MKKNNFSLVSRIGFVSLKIKLAAFIAILILVAFKTTKAQNFPSNFVQVQVANNIIKPTAMAFAPDGRIFVTQQKGELLIIKNGNLLSQPFITLTVNSAGERGLLSIAFDPDFTNNQYLYVYYTLASGANSRVSRFTANGDVVVAGSEMVLIDLDPLGTATNHNGGNIQFGVDGKLYISVGENAIPSHSQDLNTNLGKILRLNKNGTIPNDNPFKTGSAQKRSIWIYGMRNPYSMAVNAVTGKIFANDVGSGTWEEINDITKGGLNTGWPLYEGYTNYAGFKSPVYAYLHGTGNAKGCAITGGTFFTPTATNYPSQYNGNYFFTDFCGHWINRLVFINNNVSQSVFATNISGSPVGITAGPDGNIYYLSIDDGALYKIKYITNNAPFITQQPQSLSVSSGNQAIFSVAVSGALPLVYSWRKNGVTISGTNSSSYTIGSVQPGDAGNYSVTVSNTSGSKTSTAATLTVTQANNLPVANITSPVAGTTYAGGTTVAFSGTATDDEDGTLPATAFTWYVEFHHDQHIHPGSFAPDNVKSGTFDIPNSGEIASNVFYRLYLVITDSQGATDTTYVDVAPRLTTLTITTVPPGLEITYDGQPFVSPHVETTVEGMRIEIGAFSTQDKKNGVSYIFYNWENGGARVRTITVPKADVTFQANFDTVFRNPETPFNVSNDLKYSYYLGSWNKVPDFEALTPDKTGDVSNFSLTPKTQTANFGFVFNGYIEVPANGIYTFYTTSDDGSILTIGNTEVVNNDGMHSPQEAQGSIGLKAGKHLIKVAYFNRTSGSVLDVYYKGPGIQKQLIPNNALYYKVLDQEYKLNPVADAYVRSGDYSGNNYGSADLLISKRAPNSNANYRIYFRFDISGFNNDITSATLRLFGRMENNTQNAQIGIMGVDDVIWNENTINYNNKPFPNAGVSKTTIVTGTNNKYYEWELKDYVKAMKNSGNTFISILVKNNNETPGARAQFNSREAADHLPQLLVVTETPARFTMDSKSENTSADAELTLNINPNPANDNFTVTISETMKECELQIINHEGRLIKQEQITGSKTISTSEFNSGVYIIIVKNNFTVLRNRLIILK